MDQLKLLNFHKMIANFANNLVGAFIPLIIFQATGNLMLAIVYLVVNKIIRLLMTLSFKKLYYKYPQLMLLLRIIPIALYNISIFILDVNIIVGVIGVCIFLALDHSINNLSKEVIFNYSSLSNKEEKSSIGVTRLFEQIGVIVAMVIGGFLLDINKTIVLIISLVLYSISVIPLAIYYVKSRKQKTFNKDATSNAMDSIDKNEKLKKSSEKLTKKMLLIYGIVYFSFAFVDLLQTTYNLHIFNIKGSFATSGIIGAVFNCFYAIGFYIAGIINQKRDITKLVSLLSIIISISSIALPFIDVDALLVLICVIYAIIGFSYPFLSLFVLERMLLKSRIMGVSNEALFVRENSCVIAYIIGYSFGFFGLIGIFISIAVTMIGASVVIPVAEEKTRQNLVNFLQHNEASKHNKKVRHNVYEKDA